jgi:hypothetical protein
MLYIPSTPDVINGNYVCGRGLARRKLSRKQRIQLAADLACGQLQLHPSLAQVSQLVGVPQTKVREELKARAAAHEASHQPATELVVAWESASESERETAIRAIGVAEVWDVIARVVA